MFFRGILFLALSWVVAGCESSADGADTAIAFGPSVTVESGPLERLIIVDGNLYSPSTEPVVIQRIRWYWDYNISWTAEEGALVKKDDPIIKLDPSTIQKDLVERETELETEKLKLEEEEIRSLDEVAEAEGDVETKLFLLKKQELLVTDNDSVSANEKKKQQLEVGNAKKNLRRAKDKVDNVKRRNKRAIEGQKLKVKKAQEEVDEMRKGLDMMTLKAPRDGLLIFPLYSTNSGNQKARAGGGVRVNTVVAEVADPKDLVARLYVPEIDADGILPGTPGTMALDIAPGTLYSGSVKTVAGVPSTPTERKGGSSSDPADNVRQFEVSFSLEELPKGAMPGMTVRVVLNPVTKDTVIRVPIEALAIKPITETMDPKELETMPEEGEHAFVYKQSDTGWNWQQVELGALSLSHAEIKSGLKVGDVVKSIVF